MKGNKNLSDNKIYFHYSKDIDLDYSQIKYSTFLGGLGPEWAISSDVDEFENLYVTGATKSFYFPTINAYDNTYNLFQDIFITTLSKDGKTVAYSSFFGGFNNDLATSIKVDDNGYMYVCGKTHSKNFPLKNSIQDYHHGKEDVFVVKLDPSGKNTVFSTLIGGSDSDIAFGLDIDEDGYVYVTGRTKSKDFPLKNPLDNTHNGIWDAFVCKINPHGDQLIFSSYIGGEKDDWGYGITLDDDKNIFLCGNTSSCDFPLKNAYDFNISGDEGYVMKINASTDSIEYCTFIGGKEKENAWCLTNDDAGDVYVCGGTFSYDFPLKNPIQHKKGADCDIFIAKFSNAKGELMYSTYLGGDGIDDANRICVDKEGCAYITALTTSSDFPVINAFDGSYNGKWDAYVTKISAKGDTLVYSSYLGGKNDDDGYQVVVDNQGSIYIVGYTWSSNFPIRNAIQRKYGGFSDAFITKITPPNTYYPIRDVRGGFSLSVVFDSDDRPLDWKIDITKESFDYCSINESILPYSITKVVVENLFGFGSIDITIQANDYMKTYRALIVGTLVLDVEEQSDGHCCKK